ncbi:hypothetical protein L6452_34167 [Arctium lappa]|uniref:Uncharacterized protein n=1 Tax=Arctium lappa TaxID=4217 RepID=A0ACB8YI23_ARCLA|nr:hypothetical protein L6452_34167 [Arctium lappa]
MQEVLCEPDINFFAQFAPHFNWPQSMDSFLDSLSRLNFNDYGHLGNSGVIERISKALMSFISLLVIRPNDMPEPFMMLTDTDNYVVCGNFQFLFCRLEKLSSSFAAENNDDTNLQQDSLHLQKVYRQSYGTIQLCKQGSNSTIQEGNLNEYLQDEQNVAGGSILVTPEENRLLWKVFKDAKSRRNRNRFKWDIKLEDATSFIRSNIIYHGYIKAYEGSLTSKGSGVTLFVSNIRDANSPRKDLRKLAEGDAIEPSCLSCSYE